MAVNIEHRSADAKARAARAAEARARCLRPEEAAALVRHAANLARLNEAAPEVIELLPSYAARFSRPLPENKPHARAFRAALPHLRSASEALRIGNSQAVAEFLSMAESYTIALLTTGPTSVPVREKESTRQEAALSGGWQLCGVCVLTAT